MDPSAEQVPGNRDSGGKGLAQWDDRKYNLYDYAEQKNMTWQDPDLQLQFMWNELQTSERNAYNHLRNARNTKDAALVFHRYYERSADTPQMEQRRVNYALDYQRAFSGSSSNDEKYNSDWLDISKGINYGFGYSDDYANETGVSEHTGIDINYIYDPVYSVAQGKVTIGFQENGYGNYVMITTGDGLEVIYAHLSEIIVKSNDTVYPGTHLGTSGNTGFSTGPHLHFELRQDGKPFDPISWIERNLSLIHI